MRLKHYLPAILMMLPPALAKAQRQADLSVAITSPLTNSYQQTMTPINHLVRIKNLGPSDIKPTDTIGMDIILDGDTLINGATGVRPFWKRTGITIAAGDSAIINQAVTYYSSFKDLTVRTCILAYPLTAAIDTVKDPNLGNNINCVNLKFSTPTIITPADQQVLALRIYPVPANDFIRLECDEAQELQVVIADMTGRAWIRIDGYKPAGDIAVGDLPAGMYQVIVGSNGYQKSVRRFAKLQ